MSEDLAVVGLDHRPYTNVLAMQREIARLRISKALPRDVLLLVEHPPVVTLGRGSRPENLSVSRQELERRGVELCEIERGGDITFHGPGQLVGYPIFDLSEHRPDLHWFMRQLEQSVIVALQDLGIGGERNEGYTGVWTGGRKIASIGIHVKQWVSWHGFALNVTTDLSYFDLIVPCGIRDVVMTSVERELKERTPPDVWSRTLNNVVMGFAEVFRLRPQMVPLEEVYRG